MVDRPHIDALRAFNRTVTERIGALEDQYLARDRSLGLDRLLWEIGPDGAEVRELRARTGLDSGYLSRLLRSLERDGLVATAASGTDSRVRRAHLTPAGRRELTVLNDLSDDLVTTILSPLSDRQREELIGAATTVRRLFTASAVTIGPAAPASPEARSAVAAYFATLDDALPQGFDQNTTLAATDDEMSPPRGRFLLATLKGHPVGCIGVKLRDRDTAEIKRLWVSGEARGLGIGRRLLLAAEAEARHLGARTARLDTNRSLHEAIGLYRATGYEEVAPFNDEPYAHHWFRKRLTGEPAPVAARIGFAGLGIMGSAMAARLLQHGTPLTVWNRSPGAAARLAAQGARAVPSIGDLFAECQTVILMLRDETAVDEVLRATAGGLASLAAGHTIVNMGTLSPRFSRALAEEVETAGGDYVEAPVSGSQRPAQQGRLVAMTAGRPDVLRRVEPILGPMCAQVTRCGPVPSALTLKLSSSVFLITLVTALAETFHFGTELGVDTAMLHTVLDSGQMSSPISRTKSAKLLDADFTAQAAISDVLMNAELVVSAADDAELAVPLIRASRDLYRRAVAAGDGALDMVGVIRTIAAADSRWSRERS